MSIHKSQGQTLDRVKVDLSRVFEKGTWGCLFFLFLCGAVLKLGSHVGQAYVALSRATSLEGLQVLNFDPNKVQSLRSHQGNGGNYLTEHRSRLMRTRKLQSGLELWRPLTMIVKLRLATARNRRNLYDALHAVVVVDV